MIEILEKIEILLAEHGTSFTTEMKEELTCAFLDLEHATDTLKDQVKALFNSL